MRSLTVKLTLAFLLIGLTGAVMVAFLVRRSTQREFDRFVLDQNQQTLVTNLTQYYQAKGSWEGVETVFRPGQSVAPAQNQGPPPGQGRNLFVLADSSG